MNLDALSLPAQGRIRYRRAAKETPPSLEAGGVCNGPMGCPYLGIIVPVFR